MAVGAVGVYTMKGTTTAEFGPLSNTDVHTAYGSLGLVTLLVGVLLAGSYPQFAVGVAIGLALVPLARYTRRTLARTLRQVRERAETGRRPPTQSTTSR